MPNNDTAAVLEHHLEAFANGDVDEVLRDYTEESRLFLPDGMLKGLGQIRPAFEEFLGDILPPGCAFTMEKRIVDSDVAYIIWSAESDDFKIPIGTDTFVVRDGKILVQSFGGRIVPKQAS